MPHTLGLIEQTISLPDTDIHFTEAGQGSVLLLIHGSLCDYRYWRWQIPAFSQSHAVIAPSLRGYWPRALQREDPSFGIQQHVEDMLRFMERVRNGRRVHVLGHSRGAQVALEMALRAPQSINGLILADPGFPFDGEPPVQSFRSDVAELLRKGDTESALASFVDAVNGPDTWRRMVSWFKTMVHDNAYTLLAQLQESDRTVRRSDLPALDKPVLLIGGADSPERYVSRLDGLQGILPRAERVTIPLAAHGMNLANPKAFNKAVAGFLHTLEYGAPI